MDYIDITIPTKPYCKAWMENQYGSPIQLNRGDKYGTLLFTYLERPDRERDNKYRQYPAQMKIRLRARWYHMRGTSLTYTNIMYFNNVLEEDIKLLMRVYVTAKCFGPPIKKKKQAIEYFMKISGLTEQDLAYETAKKDLDRNLKTYYVENEGEKIISPFVPKQN